MVQEIREDGFQTSVRTWVYDPASGGGYTPIACLDQGLGENGAPGPAIVYQVHTDHLGTPQELTDSQGKIAWSARYTAWGKRLGPVIGDYGNLTRSTTDCHLRYPGQYEDEETGLHYNTFRYYDPDIGRIVSQDPIGILGGFNIFNYAPNSSRWIDPLGLHQALAFLDGVAVLNPDPSSRGIWNSDWGSRGNRGAGNRHARPSRRCANGDGLRDFKCHFNRAGRHPFRLLERVGRASRHSCISLLRKHSYEKTAAGCAAPNRRVPETRRIR
ncbi:MAG: hypothetical protein FIA97_00980 [Methylococcaceae bacterium]|nr:hypothetical protein [Methylococcaceae bacterium]